MPQENISEYLNPSRFPRMAFGLKANSTLNRITLAPSNANPGETLYIEIPKLSENMVIVPGSVFLVFNLTISGHENNTVVNNISRSLVKRQRIVFGGETLQDTTNYDLFQTYHDLFLPKEERENMSRHGISSENMRKLRTNAGDKDTSNGKEVAMATLHNTKYCIPLDHPILTDHGVFYPKSLPHPLKFEISLAPVHDDPLSFQYTMLSQNHQNTQSQILSWNTDAFPANFSQIKHKQLIKLITLFSMRTFFTIKPSHFRNQMTALLMSKSMSQEGQ